MIPEFSPTEPQIRPLQRQDSHRTRRPATIASLEFRRSCVKVRYKQNLSEVPHGFDGVIVATGFAPRIELARKAGLATKRGIVVNEYLRTEDPTVYAVGDAAETKGRLYPFVSPIRHQALWLASHLAGKSADPWHPPAFTPVIKVHDFKLATALALS